MTQLPAEQQRIGEGFSDVEVIYHGVCTMPLCTETNVDRHHIVRRSHLGGAYGGVEIDGHVVSNVAELCGEHHREITENKARIMYEAKMFWWVVAKEKDLVMRPQPGIARETEGVVLRPTVPFPGVLDKMKIEKDVEACPRCKGKGRIKKRDPDLAPAPKRKYKTWSMGIPVDAGEDGHEIWKNNLESCTNRIMDILGYSETVPPYYVLVAVTSDWLNSQ